LALIWDTCLSGVVLSQGFPSRSKPDPTSRPPSRLVDYQSTAQKSSRPGSFHSTSGCRWRLAFVLAPASSAEADRPNAPESEREDEHQSQRPEELVSIRRTLLIVGFGLRTLLENALR